MESWKFVCFLVVVVLALLEASPIPQTSADDFGFIDRVLEADSTLSGTPTRNGRQNYFYDYPFSYPYDYYKQVPAYPDYFNSFYDPYYAPQPERRPQPNVYPSKKKTQRRKGFPFEPTTQKYSVWDLARK